MVSVFLHIIAEVTLNDFEGLKVGPEEARDVAELLPGHCVHCVCRG